MIFARRLELSRNRFENRRQRERARYGIDQIQNLVLSSVSWAQLTSEGPDASSHMGWLRDRGGLAAIGTVNERKAATLYAELDRTGYWRPTARKEDR